MNADKAAELAELRARVTELVRGRTVLAVGDTEGLDLPAASGAQPDCAVVAFAWSRVVRDEQDAYLARLRAQTGRDALLVLLDETYVEGESAPVARTDAQGNTYQRVTGPDGAQVEEPKNYPSDSALRKRLAAAAREIRIERSGYYWLLTCRLK